MQSYSLVMVRGNAGRERDDTSISTKYSRYLGASVTLSQRGVALDKIMIHRLWFHHCVLRGDENAIVLPRYNMQYRDDYLGYILLIYIHKSPIDTSANVLDAQTTRGTRLLWL